MQVRAVRRTGSGVAMPEADLHFVGDPHGQLGRLMHAAKRHRPRAMILLGDVEPRTSLLDFIAGMRALGVMLGFIHGNHDTDSAATWQRMLEAGAYNLHGRVVDIGGVRVAGLGGVFRRSVWDPRQADAPRYASLATLRHHLTQAGRARLGTGAHQLLRHASTIFPDDVARLTTQRADVLVTHEAPAQHRFGYQAINTLACAMQVARVFHGHHHEAIDYTSDAEATGFRAWGVAAGAIVDLNGNEVLAPSAARNDGEH